MFKIISDIGADIPDELKDEIIVIGQDVSIDGNNVVVGSDEKSLLSFYKSIGLAKTYATRALKAEEIIPIIKKESLDSEILCFSFSQRLSATGSQMEKACLLLDEKRERILYYDTETATIAQGLLIYIATLCRKNGLSIKETIQHLDNIKNKLSFYVILDKSSHFFSGGRASNLEKESLYYPILRLSLGDLYKCIGYTLSKGDAISFVEKKLQKHRQEIIFIGHGSNEEEALDLKTRWRCYSNTIGCCYANPVMGVHTGDNALLIAFLEG